MNYLQSVHINLQVVILQKCLNALNFWVLFIIIYVYEFGNTYYWGGINLTENKDGCFHTNELLIF